MMSSSIEAGRSEFPRVPPLLRGLRRFSETLDRFRRGGSSPWDYSRFNILPTEITAELNEYQGSLGAPGIRAVAGVKHYEPASFYLLVKGLEKNPSAQQEILRQGIVAEAEPIHYAEHLGDIVRANIALLPTGGRVSAAKLFQVNRIGPELWDEKFSGIADKMESDHRGREKFILAYASLIGIQHFARFSRVTGEPVHVLIENWFNDPESPVCGYTIRADEGKIDILPRDFSRPKEFTLVDDTVSTWGHFRGVWGFLTNSDPATVVIDPSRTIVVDKTSPDSSANPDPSVGLMAK